MSGAIETQKTKLCINAISETVTLSFNATAKKITRASGSFVTDGIVVNSVLSTNSTLANKGPFLISAVSATELTVDTDPDPNPGFATALVNQSSVSMLLKSGLWVKEMVSFSGFDGEAADIETTSLDSTAKEFLQGLPDNGNFSAEFNYVREDPGQVAMRAARRARTLTDFQLRMSDNSIIEFAANVKGNPMSGGVDSKVDTSFSLRISGAVPDPVDGWPTGT